MNRGRLKLGRPAALWTALVSAAISGSVGSAAQAQQSPPSGRPEGSVGAAADAARAASANAAAQPVVAATAGETAVTLKRAAADAITRLALVRLRTADDPGVNHYRAAALALSLARRLAPDDAELVRQEIEAWDAAGDSARALACTTELVKLDPADTVAWLRITTSRIDRLQTADERMKAYDGLTNSKSLDASVRSRLALDAALLARDNGDQLGFLNRLTFATTLDVTNKEAAALYATIFLDGKTTTDRERAEILLNLLMSDPLDPEAHRNVSFELRRRGAFEGAFRFAFLARSLALQNRLDLAPPQQVDFQLALLDAQGVDKSLEELQKMVDVQQVQEDLRRATLEKRGRDPGPRQEIRLPIPIERLRLMIRVARNDDAGAAVSMRSLDGSFEDYAKAIAENAARNPDEVKDLPQDKSPEAIIRGLTVERVWCRLFSGMEIEQAEADLAVLTKPGEKGAPALEEAAARRFEGWILAIKGELAEAKRLLEPIADSDPSARWALGIVAQKQGDKELALSIFERLARENTSSAVGSAARLRWERLAGSPLPLSPGAKELDRAAMEFAPWLDNVVNDPRSFLAINVKPTMVVVPAMGRPETVVSLRNVSRLPLAVGVSRPVNPRVLLAPKLMIGGQDFSKDVKPEVLVFSRRLRLMPGESLDIRVWTGRGALGNLIDQRIVSPATLRWGAIQGFIFREGQFFPGPGCVRGESDIMTRLPLDDRASADVLAQRLMSSAAGASVLEPVALAGYRLSPLYRDKAGAQQDAATISAALVKRLETMSADERAATIARLSNVGALEPELRQRVLDAVKSDASFQVGTVLLLGLVTEATDPLLQTLNAGPDADFAELINLTAKCVAPKAAAEPKANDPESAPAATPEPSPAPAPTEKPAGM